VAITEGPTGQVIALNSHAGPPDWPVPILLVGPGAAAPLIEAARTGQTATLHLEGDAAANRGHNVVARIGRGRRVLVVSTPHSGWFRCGGERGPGIALLLGLARWAAARRPGVGYCFVATSGHEVGALGMQAWLARDAPPPGRVIAWLHLGAGLATYAWRPTPIGAERLAGADPARLLLYTPPLEAVAREAFAGLPCERRAAPDIAVGEMRLVVPRGYGRVLTAVATHRFHHTPEDGPEATGPELLEPAARAFARVLERLAAEASAGPRPSTPRT